MMSGRWRAVLGWALVIEALLLWPSPPSVPQGFDVPGLDKMVHASLFAVLAILTARALAVRGSPAWIAFAGSALFGAFTEFQQHFIPTRSMELGDFLADACGAGIGLAALAVWALRRREFSR